MCEEPCGVLCGELSEGVSKGQVMCEKPRGNCVRCYVMSCVRGCEEIFQRLTM